MYRTHVARQPQSDPGVCLDTMQCTVDAQLTGPCAPRLERELPGPRVVRKVRRPLNREGLESGEYRSSPPAVQWGDGRDILACVARVRGKTLRATTSDLGHALPNRPGSTASSGPGGLDALEVSDFICASTGQGLRLCRLREIDAVARRIVGCQCQPPHTRPSYSTHGNKHCTKRSPGSLDQRAYPSDRGVQDVSLCHKSHFSATLHTWLWQISNPR